MVGKRTNNNVTQFISAKPVEETQETKNAKKKRGIKGKFKLDKTQFLETSIVLESTASIQEKRVRKELEAPLQMQTSTVIEA